MYMRPGAAGRSFCSPLEKIIRKKTVPGLCFLHLLPRLYGIAVMRNPVFKNQGKNNTNVRKTMENLKITNISSPYIVSYYRTGAVCFCCLDEGSKYCFLFNTLCFLLWKKKHVFFVLLVFCIPPETSPEETV